MVRMPAICKIANQLYLYRDYPLTIIYDNSLDMQAINTHHISHHLVIYTSHMQLVYVILPPHLT
jgi:hypothetical protein